MPTDIGRSLAKAITVMALVVFTGSTAWAQSNDAENDSDLTSQTASDDANVSDSNTDVVDDTSATESEASARETLKRLDYIQTVINTRRTERSELGERIEAANEQDKSDLRRQADAISREIKELRSTLETLATGGVDSSLFVDEAPTEESDWRQDVALIAQPVIDSLKELTEKPRRIAALNDIIAERQKELDTANAALDGLAPELSLEPGGDLGKTLKALERTWNKRRDDATDAIEIANFQIGDLQGDKTLPQTIIEAVVSFVRGRGLTIVIAIAAAWAVWAGLRFLMRGYRRRLLDKSEPESRTRYRLAEYSMHALTFLLILIAVFVVFYERGDVLLLGLLILLIIGLALGIRQLLPQYVREARLLLNIGPMREAERVVYRGLPWRVESINMFTILRNPELHGVLRVPLAVLHGMTSRPAGKEPWFPTSRGDVVLFENDPMPTEVIDQNPDTVELREQGGQLRTIPCTDFYAMSLTNLTRGGTFGVTGDFPVDYRHQPDATDGVPRILRDAVREALAATDLADFVRDVLVEARDAADSALRYWIFVTMDSRAAKSHMRVERLIQAACIEASTRQGWRIPFPQLSIEQRRDD